MSFVQPVTLRLHGLRLEPLGLEHEDGLRAAAADGQLWKLRVTSVPEPHNTRAYIETALQQRRDGTIRDTVMYSLHHGEWPDVRVHLLHLLELHPPAT